MENAWASVADQEFALFLAEVKANPMPPLNRRIQRTEHRYVEIGVEICAQYMAADRARLESGEIPGEPELTEDEEFEQFELFLSRHDPDPEQDVQESQ